MSRKETPWIQAMREYNKNTKGGWTFPRKNTPEYNKVKEIEQRIKDNMKPKEEPKKVNMQNKINTLKKQQTRRKKEQDELIEQVEKIKKRMAKKGEGIKEVYNKLKDTISNIWDALKNGLRRHGSPSFRKAIEQYGEMTINNITLQRTSIEKSYRYVLDILSFGSSERTMKKLSYDDLYHLALILHMSNGDILKFEKNEVVQLVRVSEIKGQSLNVPMKKPIVLNDFISTTLNKLGENKYWLYSTEVNNCQLFVYSHLINNGLANEENNKFVNQNALQVIGQENTALIKTSKFLTDAAALFDIVLHGRGISDFLKSLFSNTDKVKNKGVTEWANKNKTSADIQKSIVTTLYNLLTQKGRGMKGAGIKDTLNAIVSNIKNGPAFIKFLIDVLQGKDFTF